MSRFGSVVPTLIEQCRIFRLPTPETEVRFHPVRRWRADLLWRFPRPLIVEVEGGVFVGGRHTRGVGAEEDCEKYAEAMLAGFPVMRVTPRQVNSGKAIQWIERFLKGATQ